MEEILRNQQSEDEVKTANISQNERKEIADARVQQNKNGKVISPQNSR